MNTPEKNRKTLEWFFAPPTYVGWIDEEHKIVWMTARLTNGTRTDIESKKYSDTIELSKIITEFGKVYPARITTEKPEGFYLPNR